MKNIYLVGFMGAGKTTVGKILAAKLNKEFIEIDQVIEERQGEKITEIFANRGEVYFRQLEKELLRKLAQRNDLIISCGGGLICNQENLRQLRESGVIFTLGVSVPVVYARTKEHTQRPLLNIKNPLSEIKKLLAERKPYYDQADYLIETDELLPEEVAEKIIKLIGTSYG